MAYIGRSVNYGNAVTQQIPGNDGPSFTLTYDTTTDGVMISLDGVTQVNGTDFNIAAGNALTFTSDVATGITINVIYIGLTLSIGTPGDGTVGLNQLSATGTPSASTVLKGDNSWGEGSEITTDGTTFSNYNAVSSNITTTTATTKNMFLMGEIAVADTYTWTIAGSGELQII